MKFQEFQAHEMKNIFLQRKDNDFARILHKITKSA